MPLDLNAVQQPDHRQWRIFCQNITFETVQMTNMFFDENQVHYDINILHPTWHKIGHFGDVLHRQSVCSNEETKPNTTKANIHQEHKNATTKNKNKKLKPYLVTSYDSGLKMEQTLFYSSRTHTGQLSPEDCGVDTVYIGACSVLQ